MKDNFTSYIKYKIINYKKAISIIGIKRRIARILQG